MDRPKLSLGSWAFSFGSFSNEPWPFSHVLEFIAEAGYDGVEINGFRPHPHPDDYNTASKCKELVHEIEGYRLGISGYAPPFGDVPPAEVDSETYLRAFRKSLIFCENCGIGTLRIDTVSPPKSFSLDEYESRFRCLTKTWHLAAELDLVHYNTSSIKWRMKGTASLPAVGVCGLKQKSTHHQGNLPTTGFIASNTLVKSIFPCPKAT